VTAVDRSRPWEGARGGHALGQVTFVVGGETLRLTDAGRPLIGLLQVDLPHSLDGGRVRLGAARCCSLRSKLPHAADSLVQCAMTKLAAHLTPRT
jgi:hypothetical protein